ncbi:PP2C family protein-serine/threonine phosphatase [Limnoglobus roseus]|uniref:Serine/threonine-protein phosphatase n=1 Tax=Limnoglobus roseus TaxID=2598579 RepID=A0A5C1ADQ8_9BACT|nr:PP2C family protein-serine/threonine phosphatase [Limnoglobus roseus]QEL17371.1 serine/threonine-protein phosphatase [Limnoglobus roseus]
MNLAPDFFDTRTRNWRARLAISSDLMRELSRYSDPQEMYRVFAWRMGQLFPTSRQLTLSRRGVEPPDVRVTRFNLWKDMPDPIAHWDRFPVVTGGLFEELLYADEPRLIDDLVVADNDPAAGFLEGQRSLLAIPVFEHGTVLYTVVLTRDEPNAFAPEQVPELVWMTNLFGRAAQTLVLSQRLKKAYEATDAEIREIAELQHSLLPAELPQVSGLEVAVHYRTANRAGGDYYDFFPQPDGTLGVLIADVSGHGTPAAVLMAITHSIAHAATAKPGRPGAFLTHLNTNLVDRYNRHSGSFITAFAAVFDPANHTLTYASAGHVPPRVLRAEDDLLVPLNRVQRLPLGINPPGTMYPEQTIRFGPGDQVVFFTDGVTETINRDGDVFGVERLDNCLAAPAANAEAMLSRILSDLDAFTNGRPTDDRTVVVVRHVA